MLWLGSLLRVADAKIKVSARAPSQPGAQGLLLSSYNGCGRIQFLVVLGLRPPIILLVISQWLPSAPRHPPYSSLLGASTFKASSVLSPWCLISLTRQSL